MPYYKICETCGLPVPDLSKRIDPFNIPCSDLHIRCIRCGWPFAKAIADEDIPDVCRQCRGKRI